MNDLINRADAIAANPIEAAPKNGTMLRLLVDYTDDGANPLEDARQAWTIGFNQFDDTEEDVWEFAGWNWEQDCFTAGIGKVVGWLPFHAIPAAQVAVNPLEWQMLDGDSGFEVLEVLTILGRYKVQQNIGQDYVLLVYPNGTIDRHPFIEAAKAAAQADYDARIRSALIVAASPAPETDTNADSRQPMADEAGIKRRLAAQTLWDMLCMENGAHEGMTPDEIQALWGAVIDKRGFVAVAMFLSALKGGAE